MLASAYIHIEPLESRIAPAFAAVFHLADLDGSNGFKMNGEAVNDFSGRSVSKAGDVNGDGFGDLLIGAYRSVPYGYNSAAAYVVFGKAGGFDATLDLSSLDGTNGFKIQNGVPFAHTGKAVKAAGDVNGDGFDDLIFGDYSASPHGVGSGAAYVVFGKANGFSATLTLSTLDGTDGFKIQGEAAYDTSGYSVSGAGDVNGDGFGDLLIGAFGADPNGSFSGAAYVIFGKADGFSATLDLSSLDGATGFKIKGEAAGDSAGVSVSGAGDINGDGIADLIVGANGAHPNGTASGASYVVFGRDTGFDATLALSSLDGTNGFQIDGATTRDYSGQSVSGVGDVNGDGFDDLLVGAPGSKSYVSNNRGAAYVIFGKVSGFGANVALSGLDGTNGFKVSGVVDYDFAGRSVSGAGDLNGDGFDDLLIGAFGADPNGSLSGAAYVVFGKATGFSATLELSTLDGRTGFKIEGSATRDYCGRSVSGAGDVNGDGFDDLLIGAYGAGANDSDSRGASYVIFGKSTREVTISADGRFAFYSELDGDQVTVRTTKGFFTPEDFSLFPKAGSDAADLSVFDLHGRASFQGADITFSAKTPPGGHGDGLVSIGAMNAGGIDLGKVGISGNLEKILAGDPNLKSAGLQKLDVGSLGGTGPGTGGQYHSVITGKLGLLRVLHDVSAAELEVVGGPLGSIGKISIGGSLGGSAAEDSGSIHAGGNIGAVKIAGDIVGGVGDYSGRIATEGALAGGSIKSVTLGGSLLGGAGQQSGEIGSDTKIGTITIGGSITGGFIDIAGRTAPASPKAAVALQSLTVMGDVSHAFIGIGYRPIGLAINSAVRLGKVMVRGNWAASSLAVGVEDSTHDGFGQNDILIPGGSGGIVPAIASLTIKGTATGSVAAGDFFGITAGTVRKAKIHGVPVPGLTRNVNDLLLDPANSDFRLVEVGST